MADQPPPRRRFQFRLRTLMIVVTLLAVPCGYIGHELRIISDRREAAKAHPVFDEGLAGETRSAPWPLGWFGEKGYVGVGVNGLTDSEIERLKQLFPEADMDPFNP